MFICYNNFMLNLYIGYNKNNYFSKLLVIFFVL
jgi:hypothetical protein